MEYERTSDFAYAVSATLLAGDIQSRVVFSAEMPIIEVALIDGAKVFWSNFTDDYWSFSMVDARGDLTTGSETLPWDVSVEDAAKMIAMHDYPAPASYPEEPR